MAKTSLTGVYPTLSEVALDLSDPRNTRLGKVTVDDVVQAARTSPFVWIGEGRMLRSHASTVYFILARERGLY